NQDKDPELPPLAHDKQTETDEEDDIDEGRANDQMPPRNTQVEEFAEITHVSPLPSHRMPEPEVQQGGGVGEVLGAAQYDHHDGPPVAGGRGRQAVSGGAGIA